MDTLLQLVFALIGLGFLVFIHELGHYWMARRVGMTVETFSIGFGKPIYSWMRQGVKWQVGWLPFGGFVKIAGTDLSGDSSDPAKDPYQRPDGFFGKRPIDRIMVAIAGPLANLILAFLIFIVIWAVGGRDKPFSEFTNRIGWVDPSSELYAKGIRPGDIIDKYNGAQLNNFKELLYAAMMTNGPIALQGEMVSELNQKTPFNISAQPFQSNGNIEGLLTVGLAPASYLIYSSPSNELPAGSPMKDSGIQPGDQIVWANGDKTFSLMQLSEIINGSHVLLTIQRNNHTFLTTIPKLKLEELKLDGSMRGELTDWQHEAGLKTKFTQLYFIPYNLNRDAEVENQINFIDPEEKSNVFPLQSRPSSADQTLKPGDKILAVNGIRIEHASQLLNALQEPRVLLIVRREHEAEKIESWKIANQKFSEAIDSNAIDTIAASIGTTDPILNVGNYYLLNPITPRSLVDFALSAKEKLASSIEFQEIRKKIEGINDPEKRAKAFREFDASQKRLVLGIGLKDNEVNYNPPPYVLFQNVFEETWRTMLALFSGYLNPKWLSGPVGIVKVMQHGWSIGIQEALYWIAVISVNLGFLNLLPIPFLDGGHILFSLFEMVTGKKLKPKVLEKLIVPFVILLIGFVIFVTYYDISRLFGRG